MRIPDWTPPGHLRAILVGGASAPERLLQRAALRRVPIVLTYGLTETCSQVVATPYAARFAPAALGAGRPLPTAAVRVVAGRIEVGGPMLMAGYLGAAPLAPGAFLDTGDLGSLDARGCLTVHARRADLIVTGGENVYPAEVERELERCPGIAAAAVFGVADDVWGETVAAALVVDPAAAPCDEEFRAWICARLAPHKRPRRVCRVERLPQTVAGKLDRDGLAALRPAAAVAGRTVVSGESVPRHVSHGAPSRCAAFVARCGARTPSPVGTGGLRIPGRDAWR